MRFEDKPTSENVIFGHYNSRCLESTYVFERGLVFQCHTLKLFFIEPQGAHMEGNDLYRPSVEDATRRLHGRDAEVRDLGRQSVVLREGVQGASSEAGAYARPLSCSTQALSTG